MVGETVSLNNLNNSQEYNLGVTQKVILLFFLIGVFNLDLRTQILWWGIHGLLIGSFLLYVIKNKFTVKKNATFFVIWYVIFTLFAILSSLWSVNINYSIDEINRLILNTVSLGCISIMCANKTNFTSIIKISLIASFINSLYIINLVGFSSLVTMGLGVQTLGEGWNANYIGITMAISGFMAYFLFTNEPKNKVVYLLASLFFLIVVLFTGSRSGLFLLLFMTTIFFYINTRKKIGAILLLVIAGSFIIYSFLNIPSLYDSIGYKIETLIFYFAEGNQNTDESTLIRRAMIDYGYLWFSNNPVFGYGINNYRELYGSVTGWYTYSHNNYIELLVGVGLIGTIIYYSGYILVVKSAIGKRNTYFTFALASIITIMIAEITMVSYFRFHTLLLICLAFSAISIGNLEMKNKE
ncbi:O-antigen ligase family protein [Salipaludibacillus aurantiacus]|uniref:O-antigen ligase n=1 Tax=Salipaludibacillus aurantiacus TaxID=1601833 RepID=A0A1H9XAF7_9BACI|nr:O-antigen ligase family protein [Salipaludibacillus aurantiacus]SES42857.1 O-antigen ligase [Salipaludibacillus aurantiacus]